MKLKNVQMAASLAFLVFAEHFRSVSRCSRKARINPSSRSSMLSLSIAFFSQNVNNHLTPDLQDNLLNKKCKKDAFEWSNEYCDYIKTKYISKKKPDVEIPQKRLVLREEDLNTTIRRAASALECNISSLIKQYIPIPGKGRPYGRRSPQIRT